MYFIAEVNCTEVHSNIYVASLQCQLTWAVIGTSNISTPLNFLAYEIKPVIMCFVFFP